MATDPSEWTWLDPQRRIDLPELAHMCRLSPAELDELVEYGALVPVPGESAGARQFSASCVAPLREAERLRSWYDLDLFTVSLLVQHLQRIAQLEQQLRHLQAHVGPPPTLPREGPAPWREPHA